MRACFFDRVVFSFSVVDCVDYSISFIVFLCGVRLVLVVLFFLLYLLPSVFPRLLAVIYPVFLL